MTILEARCPERILGDNSVFRFAQNEADAAFVVGMAEHVTHSRKIEIQLAAYSGLNGPTLRSMTAVTLLRDQIDVLGKTAKR
jgi:hypothetical protein